VGCLALLCASGIVVILLLKRRRKAHGSKKPSAQDGAGPIVSELGCVEDKPVELPAASSASSGHLKP
jgi:hypothetical protein